MAGQGASFGLDDFGLDDRLHLFTYVTTDNRGAYLWVLRAFDSARDNYHVLLHTTDAVSSLTGLAAVHHDCPHPDDLDLPRLLDALVEWGVLDRAQDGTRAATLAEYRNRHAIYQFTEAGYRAHRAVESVLSANLDDSNLSRLVFADLFADLAALAEANRNGDAGLGCARGWRRPAPISSVKRTGSPTPRSARSATCSRCCAESPRHDAAGEPGVASCGTWPPGSPASAARPQP